MPAGVTSIGAYAFMLCENLGSVGMREGLSSIGNGAFYQCTKLPEVVLPASLTAIGGSAFLKCLALRKITFLGGAPTIGGYAFSGVTATAYYPAGDASWTEEVRQDYGGKITWVSGAPGDDETEPVTDYTKGGAVVTGIEPGSIYSGEVSFTVEAVRACAVAVKNADGTYTVLKCTTADGDHCYTAELTEGDTIVVAYRGDANLDSTVNAKDATLIKQLYLELVGPGEDSALQVLAADAGGDGRISGKDATAVKQAVLKLITLEW